ncbi:MAG: hypothetical protein IT365_25745 [Candidatus Hydrogenedentes bacterium]|nr:hypothetical protein [Candidatus Hydrogenedentota bacterium]
MSLKNATLIAIVGVSISYVLVLLNFGTILLATRNASLLLSLLGATCLHGSLLVFLVSLYRGS